MTLSWAMQVAITPKLVAVSVEQTAFTHELDYRGGSLRDQHSAARRPCGGPEIREAGRAVGH